MALGSPCFICVSSILTLLHLTSSEIFTSTVKVERMILEEEELLKELKRYIDYQYDRLKLFYNFYSDRLRDVRHRSVSDTHEHLKHPNAVYHVIKKFATDYKSILGENYEIFRQSVQNSFRQLMADTNDIRGARLSLLRLQEVYNMKSLDMIEGNYLGFKGPPLGPHDAFEIGQTAFTVGKLNISLDWLTLSLQMYRSLHGADVEQMLFRPSEGSIKALIGRVHLFRGDDDEAERLYNEAKILDPTNGDVLELGKELQIKPRAEPIPTVDYFQNFSRLCSLENRNYPADPSNPKIRCRYREALLPYYRFKEEILSISPFASVIYDFVSEDESKHLKSFVENKLERGKVGGNNSVISDIRTSDLAWIWDNDSTKAKTLAKKIEHVTGLDTSQRLPDGPSSGEAFQVVNYGLGGHYEVHMDPFDAAPEQGELQYSGERIATFLIYLSNVQRGGSTVFTRVGVAVAPKKNMALFWYNFDPAHQKDDLTHHAGCPVLIGQKWICNKWIWTYGNTFRRRCGLTPDATQLDIEEDMKHGYKWH
nr:prolyl 4-hydroxylase subunit alpha-3 [Biomphalaria glabrata]